MKEITYDKKRITSTVILGIFLVISILIALIFISLTWADIDAAMESAKQETQDDPAGQMVVGGAIALSLGIVIVLAIGAYGLLLINDTIFLIFSIRNRKSTLKPIRIISYIYDGAFGILIAISIVKLILYFCGV